MTGRLRFECKFEPRDLWVGVYWNIDRVYGAGTSISPFHRRVIKETRHIYVCPLPTLCLHWWKITFFDAHWPN